MNEPDNHERFLRLFTRHEERIRRYIIVLVPHPADVDDIFQETTVALWKKFDQYDEEQSFVNWACRFAHFQILNHRKREAVRQKHVRFSDAAFEAISAEPAPNEAEVARWRSSLAQCVESLPAKQRELIELRYASDMSISEVARQTSQAVKSLYKSLARVRLRLAECVRKRLALGEGQ